MLVNAHSQRMFLQNVMFFNILFFCVFRFTNQGEAGAYEPLGTLVLTTMCWIPCNQLMSSLPCSPTIYLPTKVVLFLLKVDVSCTTGLGTFVTSGTGAVLRGQWHRQKMGIFVLTKKLM